MLISVIIPAFNVTGCIDRAIDSVLAQTHQDFEVVVVDDASSDDTAALVERRQAQDDRIRLIRSERNGGPSVARNKGLDVARGEWVAVLDADDAYAPQRLAKLAATGDREGAALVADNLQLYDPELARVVKLALPDLPADQVIPISTTTLLENSITGQSGFDFGQLKAMMRRSFLEQHQLRYPSDLRHGEDFDLYARALLAGGRFVLVGEPLYCFTQRVGTVTKKRSPFSRTRVSFEDMRRRTLALLDHPAIDPVAADLLRRRANAILWHQSRERMVALLDHRDLAGIVRALLTDWRIAALVSRKIIDRLMFAKSKPPVASDRVHS